MSKMGISVIGSYRGGCNFETVGLSRTIVNNFFQSSFKNIWNRTYGIEKKIRNIHEQAFSKNNNVLPIGGYDVEKLVKLISTKVD